MLHAQAISRRPAAPRSVLRVENVFTETLGPVTALTGCAVGPSARLFDAHKQDDVLAGELLWSTAYASQDGAAGIGNKIMHPAANVDTDDDDDDAVPGAKGRLALQGFFGSGGGEGSGKRLRPPARVHDTDPFAGSAPTFRHSLPGVALYGDGVVGGLLTADVVFSLLLFLPEHARSRLAARMGHAGIDVIIVELLQLIVQYGSAEECEQARLVGDWVASIEREEDCSYAPGDPDCRVHKRIYGMLRTVRLLVLTKAELEVLHRVSTCVFAEVETLQAALMKIKGVDQSAGWVGGTMIAREEVMRLHRLLHLARAGMPGLWVEARGPVAVHNGVEGMRLPLEPGVLNPLGWHHLTFIGWFDALISSIDVTASAADMPHLHDIMHNVTDHLITDDFRRARDSVAGLKFSAPGAGELSMPF